MLLCSSPFFILQRAAKKRSDQACDMPQHGGVRGTLAERGAAQGFGLLGLAEKAEIVLRV